MNEWLAREIAALAAQGEDTEHIWQRLDRTRAEIEELYDHPAFEAAMREHGEDLWEAWSLTRAEDKSRNTIHHEILKHSHEYWQELHNIAMSEEKVETRARILLSFLESTKQLGADMNTGNVVSLSPATIELINRGEAIFDRHPKPQRRIDSRAAYDVRDNES